MRSCIPSPAAVVVPAPFLSWQSRGTVTVGGVDTATPDACRRPVSMTAPTSGVVLVATLRSISRAQCPCRVQQVCRALEHPGATIDLPDVVGPAARRRREKLDAA